MVPLRLIPLAALLAALMPSVAAATVTQSNISAPDDGTQLSAALDEDASSPTFTVSGVAPGAADADEARIVCTYIDQAGAQRVIPLKTHVPIDNVLDSFSTQVATTTLRGPGCRLRALDQSAATPSDLTPFSGPRVRSQLQFDYYTPPTAASGRLRYGFFDRYYVDAGIGRLELEALGGCGVTAAGQDPGSAEPRDGYQPWNCAAFYYRIDDSDAPARSELRIDGQDAYTGAMPASAARDALVGLPPLTVARASDPVAGTVTVTEGSDIVRCSSPAFPLAETADATSCGALQATGVRYERTLHTRAGGRQVEVTDRYISSDGQQHALDALLEFGVGGLSERLGLRFPWVGSDFVAYKGDPSLPGPGAAPGSWFARTDRDIVDAVHPMGAATFAEAPDAVEFWGYDDAQQVTANPDMKYVRTIPAGGEYVQRWILSWGNSASEVAALALDAEDRLKPPPPPTAPPTNGGSVPPVVTPPVGTPPTPVAQACRVPKVIGRTIAQARARLTAARCALGKVRTKYVKPRVVRRRGKRVKVPYKRGRIVKQAIMAGSVRPAGTKVAVTRQGAKPRRKKRTR